MSTERRLAWVKCCAMLRNMFRCVALNGAAVLAVATPAAATGQAMTDAVPPAEMTTEEISAEILAFISEQERMAVPVRVNGAGPYRFVIDTGAERTVISRQVAALLGLAAGPSVTIAAMTGTHRVDTVRIPSIEIDALPRGQAIEAPSLEGMHLGADGLVGLDTLAGNSVIIDFDSNEMSVARSRRRMRAAGPDEIVVEAKSLAGRLIVTDARYRGQRIAVVLDTGTSVSVGNSKLRELVQSRSKQLLPVQMMSVTGRMLVADYMTIPSIAIGGAEFRALSVAFADVPPFRRLGLDDRPALFLGMDAMRLFREVRIDFANRQVRFLLPRSALAARTGSRISAF